MNALEICILVFAVALVAFTVIWNVVRKKKGKSSCGCSGKSGCSGNCGGCAHQTLCDSAKKPEQTPEDKTDKK